MPEIAKLRRAYFALLKQHGIGPELRHDFQAALTGKRSTRDWSEGDWDGAVARLQRDAGQHDDLHAHICNERPHGVARQGGSWATDEQCYLIEQLCDGVAWHVGRERGPVAYVLKHYLAGDEKALRRGRLEREVDGSSYPSPGVWRVLTRAEASGLITALLTMTKHYPAGVADGR